VSRAFVKEEQAEAPPTVPPRAPLPEGVQNYVTKRGLDLLHEEAAALARERVQVEASPPSDSRRLALSALAQRKAALDSRLASAVVVVPQSSSDEVRFATLVTVRSEDGSERSYRLVGVDEADPARGRIAFVSPVARALLGRRAGDVTTVRTPRGDETLEVIGISGEPDAAP
jgi:transcription elongation factor GreB